MKEPRLIDANALYEFVQDQMEKETGAYTRGKNKAFNIVKSALHNECAAPTIDAVPVVWRKVPDDLPEVGACVLMYYKRAGNMTVGWLNKVEGDDTWRCVLSDSGWYTDCVNPPDYWMELPHEPTERLEVDGE